MRSKRLQPGGIQPAGHRQATRGRAAEKDRQKTAIIKILIIFGIGGVSFLSGGYRGAAAETETFDTFPATGMVTMIDLGATSCIPCKMMAPIMKKLEEKYNGKAAIVFIDVWKHREQARRFKIRAIPTQIFFDKNGKEVFRHLGFMSEKAVTRQLRKMGMD